MRYSELKRDKSAVTSLAKKKSSLSLKKNKQLGKPDQPVEPRGRFMRTPMDP
jgi:hypothetical protein